VNNLTHPSDERTYWQVQRRQVELYLVGEGYQRIEENSIRGN